jgi:hypothetical protein
MKITKEILFILLCFLCVIQQSSAQTKTTQPRTIVTTDGEVDDMDSFIDCCYTPMNSIL